MNYDIPFNRSAIVGREFELLEAAVAGGYLAGDGRFGKECGELLRESLDVASVLLTPSCTAALELAALLLRLQPGDEVIVPSFAFVTTASAFALFGAKPVFVDVDAATMNLDVGQVEARITPRTRAVVALHYGGVGCAMSELGELAETHGLEIVEDNAHGLFGRYRGQLLGTFGSVATQSFHETKNFSCGEGGALVINREGLVERAEILREKGTNRARFLRGQVDKYTWVDLGSSYLPSELQAAFLRAQLESRDLVQRKRNAHWHRYATELKAWAEHEGISMPLVPEDCEHTAHVFQLVLPSLEERQRFIAHMAEHRILVVFHYQPLHLSDVGRAFGGQAGDCPVSERLGDCLIRLPLFYDLSDEELDRVIEAATSFQCLGR